MTHSDIFKLIQKQAQLDVRQALQEDIGSGDISAKILPEKQTSKASLITRQDMILCGVMWFDAAFKNLDPNITIDWQFAEGDLVKAKSVLCTIKGSTRAILSAERVALNFLQTLSATASKTYEYVNLIKNYPANILDTRKTIPGLRLAQKYAVRVGGGHNHRLGLFDAFLIKENHIKAAGGIKQAILAARALKKNAKIEVEVENLSELNQALAAGVDQVLLDNFSLADIKQAVIMADGKTKLEVSGNVSLKNLKSYARTGVDYISIGALTKNIQAIDLSLRID